MAGDDQIQASDVAQALLDLTGEALMSGDFENFRAAFALPHPMTTLAGPVNMETVEDLRRAFDAAHQYLVSIGATDFIRRSTHAIYITPTQIEATHVADVLKDGKRMKPQYGCFSVLEKRDGIWQVVRSEYLLEPNDGQARAIARADVRHRPKQSND